MSISKPLMQQFRNRLVKMSSDLAGDIEAIEIATQEGSGGQARGEISNAPMHLGDMGTEEYLHQLNTTLLSNESQLRSDVAAAIERCDSGSYGICTECSGPIAPERLEALPATPFCIRCASKADHITTPNLNDGRPLTPADTLAPEGQMGERRRSNQDQFADAEQGFDADNFSDPEREPVDIHAVGTPGGGGATGGLAGSNVGRGEPQVADAEDEMGSGRYSSDPVERLHRRT